MDQRIARHESAVVACSALRRSYRDQLLGGRPQALMIFLTPDREVLTRRLAARHGHFFPGQLLGSQCEALEPPGPDERVISVGPGDDPASTVAAIVAVLWPGEGARIGAADARAGTLDTAGGDHEAKT